MIIYNKVMNNLIKDHIRKFFNNSDLKIFNNEQDFQIQLAISLLSLNIFDRVYT